MGSSTPFGFTQEGDVEQSKSMQSLSICNINLYCCVALFFNLSVGEHLYHWDIRGRNILLCIPGQAFLTQFHFFEVISIVFMLWIDSLRGQQGPIHPAPADSAVPGECASCTALSQNTIQILQIDKIWICHSFEVEPSFTLIFFYSTNSLYNCTAYCVMWVTSLWLSQVFRHNSWFFFLLC